MAEEERKINLQGTVKEKSHYKDYKIYPNSWRFRMASGLLFIFLFFVALLTLPSRVRRTIWLDNFFDLIGMPGMILICLLLSYALFWQIRKRWR